MIITLGIIGSPDTRQKMLGKWFVQLQILYVVTQSDVKVEDGRM
jgi:hypothetical protein